MKSTPPRPQISPGGREVCLPYRNSALFSNTSQPSNKSATTMSWNTYVDTQLVATGAIVQAGIFGKADMQCYASAGDFQVWLLQRT